MPFFMPASAVQTMIPAGTYSALIGNMTSGSGLAAAFNGVTSANAAASASIVSGDRTTGYCGKDWGSGVTKTLTGFRAYACTDYGFDQLYTGTSQIDLEGSTDNFSSSVVNLGSITFTDGASVTVTKLTGLTTTTAYRYHRLKFTSTSGTTSTDNKTVAEIEFYEDI